MSADRAASCAVMAARRSASVRRGGAHSREPHTLGTCASNQALVSALFEHVACAPNQALVSALSEHVACAPASSKIKGNTQHAPCCWRTVHGAFLACALTRAPQRTPDPLSDACFARSARAPRADRPTVRAQRDPPDVPCVHVAGGAEGVGRGPGPCRVWRHLQPKGRHHEEAGWPADPRECMSRHL
eukprot:363807-Chlamydomonas_euryale.AAC.5